MGIEGPNGETYEMDAVMRAAVTAHEVNRAFCIALGDDTTLPWECEDQQVCNSVLNGVLNLIENPGMSPAESHQSWLDQKEADGWVWGPAKIRALKEHPNMVPYDELSSVQRAKDSLFQATVRGVLGLPEPKPKATLLGTIKVDTGELGEVIEALDRITARLEDEDEDQERNQEPVQEGGIVVASFSEETPDFSWAVAEAHAAAKFEQAPEPDLEEEVAEVAESLASVVEEMNVLVGRVNDLMDRVAA